MANINDKNINMEEQTDQTGSAGRTKPDPLTKQEIANLEQKVNVDEQAIREAREAVGDDEKKIREYLINNRGL